MVTVRPGRGFTLLELIVTFVVVAVVGLAVTFVATRVVDRADDDSAPGRVSLVVLAQTRFAQRYGTFTSHPTDLGPIADEFAIVNTVSDGPGEVSIALGAAGSLGIAVRSGEDCLLFRLDPLNVSAGAYPVADDGTRACQGASALPDGEPEADEGRHLSKRW
jgi:type II secretory pathway pseudopilin PulG